MNNNNFEPKINRTEMSDLNIFSTIGILVATVMIMSASFNMLIKRRSGFTVLRTFFAAGVIVVLSTVLTPADIATKAIGATNNLAESLYGELFSEWPESINDGSTDEKTKYWMLGNLAKESGVDLNKDSSNVKTEDYAGKIND